MALLCALQGNDVIHWPTSDTYVNQHTAFCARWAGAGLLLCCAAPAAA